MTGKSSEKLGLKFDLKSPPPRVEKPHPPPPPPPLSAKDVQKPDGYYYCYK